MTELTPGEKRWTLLHGAYDGVEKQALLELHRGFSRFLNYVLPIRPADEAHPETLQPAARDDLGRRYQPTVEHAVLMGTVSSNRLIADLAGRGIVPMPRAEQGFVLWVGPSPFGVENRLIVVAGADAPGVYYGVQELLAMLSENGAPLDKPVARRAAPAALADCAIVQAPAVRDRGLWTWGYVIYDYRRFLDHMARLKFNMLTIWNSEAPRNLAEVCAYAHARGIRIIAGFNWGWGHKQDLSTASGRAFNKKLALDAYREEYAGLPIDGLYFQTETEHTTQEIGGRSVAAWCCDMVNETAAEFYAMAPNLSIQFGLHATSIGEHFTDLAGLDPRVTITWEDAGALPFSYAPRAEVNGGYEATLAYAKRLAAFRPGTPFALVPKGWMCLRWGDEFAKHGPLLIGERDPAFLRERLAARQPEWDAVNSAWFRLYPRAARFYREVLEVNPVMLATGLVEDGLFEARIQPSVALFAETLWNPRQDDFDLLARAQRPYVNNVSV